MKSSIVLILPILLTSCWSKSPDSSTSIASTESTIEMEASVPCVLQSDSVKSKIKAYANSHDLSACSYDEMLKRMEQIKQLGYLSIPVQEQLVRNCVNSFSEVENDSLYSLFSANYFNQISSFPIDSLIDDKFMRGIEDDQTRDYLKTIDLFGFVLSSDEGTFYVDQHPDYLYKLFDGKASDALTDYLKINSAELKQGFQEDAGLLISFNDLYKRVVTWETFIHTYPDFFLKRNAQFNYRIYLSTLLTGMDNTSAFESDGLIPEVKSLYEEIIAKNDTTQSTRVINKYYNLLKTNDFKQLDDMQDFYEEFDLLR